MRFLSTLVACCSVDECESSATLAKEKSDQSFSIGVVREKKLAGGGKTGGKNGRPSVQWRPSLCTIYEKDVRNTTEDVVKTKRIRVHVSNRTASGYKQDFVLRGSWDMISPVPTSFIF
ncbi:hypothetical protein L2E82_40171 [Cichorium intybus]|uniref:Uncharacterized protein n=1 Tax=Cichorium intybus TaxID=13427 RepID=A0ACB9AKA0_CICIN|nr:hypothetical protein L2E82_40171 [Cichorium intybus]